MDHPLHDLIEAQLHKAKKEGAFDNLAGQGKPLTHLKKMNNVADIMLESAKDAPSPLAFLRDEIATQEAALTALSDPQDRKKQMHVIGDLRLKLALDLETLKRIG